MFLFINQFTSIHLLPNLYRSVQSVMAASEDDDELTMPEHVGTATVPETERLKDMNQKGAHLLKAEKSLQARKPQR